MKLMIELHAIRNNHLVTCQLTLVRIRAEATDPVKNLPSCGHENVLSANLPISVASRLKFSPISLYQPWYIIIRRHSMPTKNRNHTVYETYPCIVYLLTWRANIEMIITTFHFSLLKFNEFSSDGWYQNMSIIVLGIYTAKSYRRNSVSKPGNRSWLNSRRSRTLDKRPKRPTKIHGTACFHRDGGLCEYAGKSSILSS